MPLTDALAPVAERPLVTVVDPIHPQSEQRLAELYRLQRPADRGVDALFASLADASGLIVRTTPISRGMLDAAPGLRVVAKHGTGTDSIDVRHATERGIVVTRTGGANGAAVAEFALTAILLLCKAIIPGARWLRDSSPAAPLVVSAERAGLVGRELSETVVGVVGWGAIGRRVGTSIAALGGSVVAYDPVADTNPDASDSIRFTKALPMLLCEVDVLTVHVPLTAETRGLIGAPELALMPRGGALVNTARGGVVDETALADAIESGHVRAAVIDVFEREPPGPEDRLTQLDQVVCTPHIAGTTSGTLRRMGDAAVDAVIDVLSGRRPADVANPEVFAAGAQRNG